MTKYNIGQELVLTDELETEGAFGKKVIRKKGTKLYVTARKKPVMAMYPNGNIQIIDEAEVEGFSVVGIAKYLYQYLSRQFPMDELLEGYDIEEKEFKEAIEDALEDLGMYDNTGNRS